jgi:hypothetical protein
MPSKSKVIPRSASPRPKDAPPKPWELQEGEDLQNFRYFCFYRDMQRRAIRIVAKTFNHKSQRAMERVASQNKWAERARAWDIEMDRRVRDIATQDRADMLKRHINLGVGMQTAAVKDLKALIHKIEAAAAQAEAEGKPFHEPVLRVDQMIALGKFGTYLERGDA